MNGPAIDILRLEFVQERTDRQGIDIRKIGKDSEFFGDRIQRPQDIIAFSAGRGFDKQGRETQQNA